MAGGVKCWYAPGGAGCVLAVGVEPVDAKLDFGENATGGVQLAVLDSCRYHLRNVGRVPWGGAESGEMQRPRTGKGAGVPWV
jgi:hypothetical protein